MPYNCFEKLRTATDPVWSMKRSHCTSLLWLQAYPTTSGRGSSWNGVVLQMCWAYQEAENTLRAAMSEYSGKSCFAPFLALALHNLGRHDEASSVLMKVLLETAASPEVREYHKALSHANEPGRVW